MTSTSNSKTTSGNNTSITSPNTYSYQVTSQFGSSGSPGSSNSYDEQNLENMLNYALKSKRVPQKQVIKRELKAQASNEVSSLASQDSGGLKTKGPIITPPNIAMKAKPVIQKYPDGAIVIQPTGGELYTGKGKGKRKKKNNKQIQMLEKAYKARNDWNREDIINLAKFTGLTKSQIYKWNWDIRKRGKFTEQEVPNQVGRAKQSNELPFMPGGFGNKTVDLQAPSESSDNRTLNTLNKMGSIVSDAKSSGSKSRHKVNQPQPMKNPYLQQLPQVKTFYTGKKEKMPRVVKKANMNVNKKVKALETKFQKINIEAGGDGPSTDMTPDSCSSHANQFSEDAQIFTQSIQEQKQSISQKQQPPPSTPVYEQFYEYQNDNKNIANVTLLRYRNYSEANFNQDEETQSVPDIILENEEGEDCQQNITNFIQQRQRSNSLGAVTSQQTQNYLDEFLLENQSIPPYSKKQSTFNPSHQQHNQEFLNHQTSDISGYNMRFGSGQNNPNTGSGQYKPPSFKLNSLSSDNTAFKFIKNNSIGGGKSQDRSSESSWKQAFRQPGRENSVQFTQAGIAGDQKYGYPGEDMLYKLPQDLSAQARIDKQGGVDDSIVRSSISGVNKMKQQPQSKLTSSITGI